jgi:hypothetical protein
MHAIAVECGVDSSRYWDMTPREISAAITAYNKREAQRYKLKTETIDTLLWIAGKYNSYAVNNPKKYPKKPYLSVEEQPKYMDDTSMEAWARKYCENY